MKEYLFEVCANSVESCIAAQAGGANRVELCAGIPEGGTTPSYGDIVIAREVLQNTRLHVIIRPRSGDFLYSPIEQRIMLKDIDNARRLGWNCLYRAWKRYRRYKGRVRESMAAGCPERFDWEFIRWILWDGRQARQVTRYQTIGQNYPDKFLSLKNQKELDEFLKNIQ